MTIETKSQQDRKTEALRAEARELVRTLRKTTTGRLQIPVDSEGLSQEAREVFVRVFAEEGEDIDRVTFVRLPTPGEAARDRAEALAVLGRLRAAAIRQE